MNRIKRVTLLLVPLLFACGDLESPMAVGVEDIDETARFEDVANVSSALSTGSADVAAASGLTQVQPDWSFHFLQPLAPDAGDVFAFDASLTGSLVVEICATVPGCANPKRLDSDGRGSERLRLQEDEGFYMVNWHGLQPGTRYHLRVLVADLEIGALTVQSANRGRKSAASGDSDAVVSGGAVPIKFRVDAHPIIRARVLTQNGASATELAAVLADEFGLGPLAVAELLFHESYSAPDAGFALHTTFGIDAQQSAGIERTVGWQVENIAEMVNRVYQYGDNATAKVLKAVDFTVEEVSRALDVYFELSDQAVVEVLKGVDFTVEEISKALDVYFEYTDQAVVEMLKAVDFTVEEIARALDVYFEYSGKAVVVIMKAVRFSVEEITRALDGYYEFTDEVAAEMLVAAGFAANEVAGALQSVYELTEQGVAQILRDVGYTADEVAGALRDVFNQSAESAARILKNVGYTANQVATVLSSTFDRTASAAGQIMRDVGYSADQIAGVMRNVFGWSADQVAGFMKDVLGFSQGIVEGALSVAGYAASEIKNAIEDFFGDVGDVFCGIFGC